MTDWKQALREGAISGSMASVLSAAALARGGRRENGASAAPVNAISHWLWGRAAFRQDHPTLRHTLVGYLIHHCASVFWGVLHAGAWGNRSRAKRPVPALAGATAAAAIACFVDYRMTPERLTPGFEHRLSTPAMIAVYGCFALGLALGSMAAGRTPGANPVSTGRSSEPSDRLRPR